MKLFGQISAGTIARTACLALALTNQILSATGHPVLPIEAAHRGQPARDPRHHRLHGGGQPCRLVEKQQLHPRGADRR